MTALPPDKDNTPDHAAGNGTGDARLRALEAELAEVRARLHAEQEARQALQQDADAIYEEMFHRNTAPKLLIDPDTGAIVDANPAAVAFYGHTLSELRALRIQDINLLSDDEVQAEMELARREQRRYFEFRHRVAGGEVRNVKVYSGPVEIRGRTLLHSIVHDFTDAMRHRNRLERHRAIFETLPVGLYRNRPGNEGRFEEVNPAMARIFGASSTQALLGQSAWRLYRDPDERRRFSEELLARGRVVGRRMRLQTLDGRPIMASVTASVGQDPEGRPVFDGIVQDITEQYEAEQARVRVQEILEATSDLVGMADPQGRVLYQNAAFIRFAGGRLQQLDWRLDSLMTNEAARLLREVAVPAAHQQGVWQGETMLLDAAGRQVPVSQTLIAHRDGTDSVQRYSTIIRDMSEERAAELMRRRILQSLAEGVFGIDAEGRITFMNPAACRLLGLEQETVVLGQNAHALFHHSACDGNPLPESSCPIQRVLAMGTELEAWQDWFWRQDGSGFPVEVFAAPLTGVDGQTEGSVVAFIDITRRKAMEQELERLATHDPLTGLANRARLYELLERARAEHQRYGTPFAVIMLDIDRFKRVNDRFGHQVGDQVLCELTQRINGALRETDIQGRWGGEEFMVIATQTDLDGATALAERLRVAVARDPFEQVGPVTISLGVAGYQTGESLEQLEERVDQAMYRAKEGGRDQVAVATPQPPGTTSDR